MSEIINEIVSSNLFLELCNIVINIVIKILIMKFVVDKFDSQDDQKQVHIPMMIHTIIKILKSKSSKNSCCFYCFVILTVLSIILFFSKLLLIFKDSSQNWDPLKPSSCSSPDLVDLQREKTLWTSLLIERHPQSKKSSLE